MKETTPTEELAVWIQQLKIKNPQATNEIWQRCFEKVVAYASRRLGGSPRREADEEDVALSAMHNFFRGVDNDRFSQLATTDDLWKVLFTVTDREAKKQLRTRAALKRGGGEVRGESVFENVDGDGLGIAGIEARSEQCALAETLPAECAELLEKLHDEQLRRIAMMKLHGYTNTEIARKLCCAVRSVERKLRRIRQEWENETR